MRSTAEDRLHLAFCVALTLGAAAAFYGPALRATGGEWPAPLDDVFIHFDFARSTAGGHPFEWIAGQGYSSGETAPLYPFVLAAGYLAGFRGLWLGLWAAIVACASLVVTMRSLRELARPAAWWVPWVGAAMLVSVGVLDWSWFSGMEIALFTAVAARALVAAKRAREAPAYARARAQARAGAWCAALVLLRPEACLVVGILGVMVARRAGAGSARAALARVILPAAAATALVLGANLWLTGDAQSAGARLKLLSGNPFLSDVARARELALNLGYVKWKILETFLAARPSLWPLLPAVACAGLFARRTRALAATCLLGALGWTLLVSWNGAARFQNFRYYMPALALVLVAGTLGLAALSRRRWGRWAGGLVAAAGIAAAVPRVAPQIAFFRDAAENVHDQQVEVGRRLARIMPAGARVLVGDAGAIAYASGHHAVDALGLGGYGRLPFARAAVLGEPAIVELVERMRPEERPGYLALYPNWFAAITGTFGHEIDRVSLAHNVICGGISKGIYLADWSVLAGAASDLDTKAVDEIDVADVVSEIEHDYLSPAPDGGWTALEVRGDASGRPTFDGGRIIPEGRSERFVLRHGARAPAALLVRTGGEDAEVDVAITRAGAKAEHTPLTRDASQEPGRWSRGYASLARGARAGDVVTLTARRGTWRDFHVWLVEAR